MNWTNVIVPLAALKPWEHNPKTISKSHAKRLLKLFDELGQFQTIAIGPGGEVYDGHQRLSVLLAAHGSGYELKALQSERALTEEERAELIIAAHVGTVGQFDWGKLAGWDTDTIREWGLDDEALQGWNSDAANLATMLGVEQSNNDSETPDDKERRLGLLIYFENEEDRREVYQALQAQKMIVKYYDHF